MQMKKLSVAVSGPVRAMETAPSRCRSPVAWVRSSGIAGNGSSSASGLRPPWMTAMRIVSSGWFSAWTVRKNLPPS